MNPTRCLRDEHQLILKVLDCFEIALSDAHAAGRTTRDVFQPFIEFFQGFADRCHQARGMVGAIAEHIDKADGGDVTATNTVLRHGADYLDLLRAHIGKEDHCLFGMADQLIQGEDLTVLNNAYEEAQAENGATDTQCRAIANTLMEKYGVAVQ